MNVLFKIYFLFFFITNIKMTLTIEDGKPLDLVSDDDLYYDHNFFDIGTYQQNLEKLSSSYKTCLEKNGIRETSFNKCVGKGYTKIDRQLKQQLQQNEAILKSSFAHNLSPLCKNDNVVLCSDLIDSLNMSFVRFENPVPNIQKLSEDFVLTGKGERKLTEVIHKLADSYKKYQNSEYLMHQIKGRTLHEVKNYIEGTGIDVDYNISFDDMQEDVRKEVEDKLNNSSFHEDLARRVSSDVMNSFVKLNGPTVDQNEEKHDIIVL